MTVGTLKRIGESIWNFPLVLYLSCSGPNPPPSLVGTVIYDDSNTRAQEKFVPLAEATVFITVKDDFQPPDARFKDYSIKGADRDSPEGRRSKALQDLIRMQPAGFNWKEYKPVFAGEPGEVYDTQIDDDGRFRFDTLPAGRHMLTVCYKVVGTAEKRRRSMAREVVVRDGQTTNIEVVLTRYDFIDL